LRRKLTDDISIKESYLIFLNKISKNFCHRIIKLKKNIIQQLQLKKFVFVFGKKHIFAFILIILIISSVILVNNNLKPYISGIERFNNKILGGLEQESITTFETGDSPIPSQLKNSYEVEEETIELSENILEEENNEYYVINQESFTNPNYPIINNQFNSNIIIYKVKKGDNVSDIAERFNIDIETITLNNNIYRNRIFIGQELLILPISGLIHKTEKEDTLEYIANFYSTNIEEIIEFNNLENGVIQENKLLIIPNGKIDKKVVVKESIEENLPVYPNYYLIPTTGINWGEIHYNNGVDISNKCGTDIVSSAEGLITEQGEYNGYGNYIKIQHPNNTETLYAHLQEILIEKGDYIERGQLIGLIGNTGNSTGCHLHFEVRGARNPFGEYE
jgi:murein DD-endopeptidase MepM/ murein hydrolase activator NlpD